MNIVPSSTIHLLKNVPLNTDYNNTIRFASRTAQINYFGSASLHVRSYTNQQYQRYGKDKLRIEGLAEDLYNANYLAFQNTGHGEAPKWYYAFVTSVDYVNENATEITYILDVIQTYMFDIEVGECFIEREHTSTDELDDWAVPENIETGEYMKFLDKYQSFGDMRIVAVDQYYFTDSTHSQVDVKVGNWNTEQGTFEPLAYTPYVCTNNATPGELNAVNLGEDIHDFTEYADNLVDLAIVPKFCLNGKKYDSTNDDIINRSDNYPGVISFSIDKPTTFDGYEPKCKKVLTYPYVSFLIDDNMGNTKEYLYEYFYSSDNKCNFKMYGNISPSPVVNVTPKHYKRCTVNWNETLESTGYPTCASNIDTFKQWVAENKTSLQFKMLQSIAFLGAGAYLGMPLMAGAGAYQAKDLLTQVSDKKVNAFKMKVTAQNSTLQNALEHMGLNIYRVCVTKSMAKTIDNYFYMYGYAVHKLKVPNVFGGGTLRPYWNYLKTNNCNLSKENCPAAVSKKICDIFNKGITFWENPYKVGDYTQGSNTPAS